MRLKLIILSTFILNSCSIMILGQNSNYNETPQSTILQEDKKIIIEKEKVKCIIDKYIFDDTPKLDIDKIINTKADKEKSLLLADYIKELRIYISDIKKEVRQNDENNFEKCSK